MTALSSTQQRQVAGYWASISFAQVTANFALDQIQAAAAAIDNALDTTLNAAVAAGHGAETVVQALNSIIPAPFSGASAQAKTLLVCHVIMKRAGII